MNEREFAERVRALASTAVEGLDAGARARVLRRFADELTARGAAALPICEIVPFTTGRRPLDEARNPGLGSSDCAGLLLPDGRCRDNRVYVLYRLHNLNGADLEAVGLEVTLSFVDRVGEANLIRPGARTATVPGWSRRRVPFQRFVAADGVSLGDAPPESDAAIGAGAYVFAFDPAHELLPGAAGDWSWTELPAWLRNRSSGDDDPFDFGHQFFQTVRIELSLVRGTDPLSTCSLDVDVCDARRFGSLYRRIVELVLDPDVAEQDTRAGGHGIGREHHPWFPVLEIGTEKADLYMSALIEDISAKAHHLTDPLWLLRVGLYLELLTCLGVIETVRPELGDLLSPRERACLVSSPVYAEIRRRLDVDAWRRVWALRQAIPALPGLPHAGPVSLTNLLAKKKATLAFLHTHHDDLKQAIDLAGRNVHNAQETWHRVFRDAERAVLRKSAAAFPELASLPRRARDVVLWYRHSAWIGAGAQLLPRAVRGLVEDQEGLYASACNQYRHSMNDVAVWARARGLMDYTGDSCIPEAVSLLATHMAGDHDRLARLQRCDGYAPSLESLPAPVRGDDEGVEQVKALVDRVSLLGCLTGEERMHLANRARRIELGPMARILIEGREGSSLFIVAEGELEALKRNAAGADEPLATLRRHAVIGEMSLLTGQPRSATVRAVDGAVVYEVGRDDIRPILEARPELADQLADLMTRRLQTPAMVPVKAGQSIGERVRQFLLG